MSFAQPTSEGPPTQVISPKGPLAPRFRVTRVQIILITVLIAVVGAFFLYRTFAASSQPLAFYRLYNAKTRDYLYTANLKERDAVTKQGYKNQGVAGYIYDSNVKDTKPLYRLYNKSTKIHMYTTSSSARTEAKKRRDFRDESVAGYINTTAVKDANQFYRLYNARTRSYFYTNNTAERTSAINNGYVSQATEGYLLTKIPPIASKTVENFAWNSTTKKITWSPYAGADGYKVAIINDPATIRNTKYVDGITGTSYAPPAANGVTVNYGIIPVKKQRNGTWTDLSGARWATEIVVQWPSTAPIPTIPTIPVPPTNPGSSAPSKYLGLVSAYTTADAADLVELHANSVRSELAFNGTSFGSPNYSGTTEQWFTNFAGRKITPLPLFNSYDPLSTISSASWSNAVVTWCKSYCSGGTYWANRSDKAYAPKLLEMFNEPEGNWYRGGKVEPKDFVRLLKATRTAMDAAGLQQIGLLGAASLPNDNFTNTVLAEGGYNVVQGVVVHGYGPISIPTNPNPTNVWSWDRIYPLHEKLQKDIYVTEAGWCTTTSGECENVGAVTIAQKNANINAAIGQLKNVPWLKGYWYFNLHDFADVTFGLRDINNNKYPAWDAFRQAAINNGF